MTQLSNSRYEMKTIAEAYCRMYEAGDAQTQPQPAPSTPATRETPATPPAAKPQDGNGGDWSLGKNGKGALNGALLGAGAGAAAGALTHMMKGKKARRRGSVLKSMASGALMGGAAGGALGYGMSRWGDKLTAPTDPKEAAKDAGKVSTKIDTKNMPEVLKDINPKTGKPYKYENLDPNSTTAKQIAARTARKAEVFNNQTPKERMAQQEQANAARVERENQQRAWEERVSKARLRRYEQDQAEFNRAKDREIRFISANHDKDYDYLLNGQYNLPR